MTRRLALLAAVGYLVVVAVITLGPTPWRTRPAVEGYDVLSLSTWLSAGTWASGRPQEFLANILLFVPLGLLVRLGVPRLTWIFAGAVGVSVSVAIEVLQVGSVRVSDPRDLVANSVGAVVGAVGVAVGALAARAVAARPPQGDSDKDLVLSNIRSTRENGSRKD
jgi:glycopeptide antibiotics resistance protein